MKATQIFRGSFFALQNSITLGNNIPCWSQLPQLGLKSGTTTISFHGNHYVVKHNTNSSILPIIYHLSFSTFTKAICHEKSDVTIQATRKQQYMTRHLTRLPITQEATRTSDRTSSPHMSRTRYENDRSQQFIQAFNHGRDVMTSFAAPELYPMHDSEGATPPKAGFKFLAYTSPMAPAPYVIKSHITPFLALTYPRSTFHKGHSEGVLEYRAIFIL
jgi:hypothetical protein